MNPDSITSRLVGTWHAVPNIEIDSSYLRIYDDLRSIGVFARPENDMFSKLTPWQSMRVRLVLESDTVLQCSGKIGGSTWTRGIHFEGECLILDGTQPVTAEEPEPPRQFYRCYRIAVDDLPEGVEEVFDREMAKEWT